MKKIFTILTFLIITIIFFSCSDNSIRNKFKEEQKSFTASLESFLKANEESILIDSLKSGQPAAAEQFIADIETGIAQSELVSDNYLDYIHPNLKATYRNDLVGSYKLIIDNIGITDSLKLHDLDLQTDQKIIKFREFLHSNQDDLGAKFEGIDKKTFPEKIKSIMSGNENNKSYWRMFIRFFISNIVSVLVFSLFVIVLHIPLYLFTLLKQKTNSRFLTVISHPFIIIPFIGEILFWILWSGYCVLTILFYINSPSVSHQWVYYLTGFISVLAPFSWLSNQERRDETSAERVKRIETLTILYNFLIITVFVTFCIWPNLLEYKLFSLLNDFFYK